MKRTREALVLSWLALVVAVVAACNEKIAAPGVCPEYCPTTDIEIIDSLLVGSIVRDESFGGYVFAHESNAMQLVSQGVPGESRAVIRFIRFEPSLAQEGLTTGRTIIALDSFQVRVLIQRRTEGVTGMELVVHRLPITVDPLVTFASLAPYFADSTVIATVAIPDTLPSDMVDTITVDTVAATLGMDAFPTFEDDSLRAAVGLILRADAAGFVSLGSVDGGQAALLRRFVQVAAADSSEPGSDSRRAVFDTYVLASVPSPDPDALTVGGVPSSRTLLRVDLPPGIADSSEIVRATLVLVPSEPALGAPGDTFRLRAEALATDIGAKSPIIPTFDSLGLASTLVPVRTTDAVLIDVTRIMRPWRTNPDAPRALMLRVAFEAASIGEVRFKSTRSATGAPVLRVTYVPLLAQRQQ